ncbi:MAG TPA: MFS transporter [Gemmatimonadaceae bacterium]|nr:MFS transporter [Gemmatimonadaceae bacterium]
MIDLSYFKDDEPEARRILDAMSRLASERAGHACTFSLAPALDAAAVERVFALQQEAFGAPDAVFTAGDLQEVLADPDALFLQLTVDGRLEGWGFGYYEWPDKVTVPGTDFFIDSAMIAAPYRGRGIGKLAVAGMLLLTDLLECRRVGIAAWRGGAHTRGLVRFYQSFGFARVAGGAGPHIQMAVAVDNAVVARWLLELQLSLGKRPVPASGRFWPRQDERALAGRFYVAMGFAEALYLIAPFEFAYLYLAMARPDWAVLAVGIGTAAAFLAGVPAGVMADRWSRKVMVLLGGSLVAAGLGTVPLAVTAPGIGQLVAAGAAFAVMGAGQTLMMSAAEAWVVDNLQAAERADLVEAFYGRVRSVSAGGAALAATGAFLVLLGAVVNRPLLDLLWYVGAGGFVLATLVAVSIPERRPVDDEPPTPGLWRQAREALAVFGGRRALAMIAGAIVLGAASGVAAQEAFTVALITQGFDARLFAPLSIVDSLIGMVGPIVGIALARRLGATRFLWLTLLLEAVSTAVLFLSGGIGALIALYVMLDMLDDAWDPVALARLQSLTPSRHRAAISALVYQVGALAEFGALGVFALLLGRHREALERATPDLLEAFSGTAAPPPRLPAEWLGLTVPEFAVVLFIGIGAAAMPLVVASGHRRAATNGRPH